MILPAPSRPAPPYHPTPFLPCLPHTLFGPFPCVYVCVCVRTSVSPRDSVDGTYHCTFASILSLGTYPCFIYLKRALEHVGYLFLSLSLRLHDAPPARVVWWGGGAHVSPAVAVDVCLRHRTPFIVMT